MSDYRIKIGVIGLNFGRYILQDIAGGRASEFVQLAAVCDLDQAKVDAFANQYSVKGYTDLDDLLADPEIEAIGLFTGPERRAQLLSKIIRAGKDVMTTKPFELDPGAAQAVLDEAKALGRVIHLNSPRPKPDAFIQQILAWQEEFNLGQFIYCGGEVTASYREKADGSWLDDPERCPGGPLFRLGIYLINDIVRLVGGIDSVQALTSRIFTERPTPDNANLSIRFCNGAIGNIFASFCVQNGQHYGNSLILHFENGSIYRNCDIFDFGTAMKSSHLRLVTVNGEEQQITQEWKQPGGSGQYAWNDFHEAVRSGDAASTPAKDIVHGVQVIAALMRALQTGQLEKVDNLVC